MIIMIAIVIIVILILVDKDEIQREKELENQIVGFNTMNGHPILRKHVNINGYDTRTGQPIFEYKKPIIGQKYYNVERNEALPNFVGNNINYLENWASSRNITIYTNYITENMEGYNENQDGIITYQNVISGTLVSSINSISVNVIKVTEKQEEIIDVTNNNNIENNQNEI